MGRGPERGQGQGMPKKTPRPRRLSWMGREKGWGPHFSEPRPPRPPRNELYTSQYRQRRALLSFNLYLSLPPDKRANELLSSLPAIALSKMSKPEIYPPSNDLIYASKQIRALWQDHLFHGKQPDSRLRTSATIIPCIPCV